MPKATQPQLFVVDGSNIATEGRSAPSLEQLNDAVMAFLEERPNAVVTVVVDATFGHRISSKEVAAFDEAVANNELVTPPAGAIGRGDAFVLSIANKAKAGILSNDSFQEFHGDYDWLFDEGRLIGGKPVPYVGWVFVARTPVRGPKSRRSVRGAKDDAKSGDARAAKEQANRRVRPKAASTAGADEAADSPADDQPEATPKRRRGGRGRAGGRASAEAGTSAPETQISATPPGPKDHVNDLMPFIEFVEKHPVGTSCTAEVESYASHGAYARAGDVLIYLPLRMLDDPPPRSAKSALRIGESIAVVIIGFTPDRRSIDAALPHMATAQISAAPPSDEPSRPARKRSPRKPAVETTIDVPVAKSAPARSGAGRTAAKKTAATKTPAQKTAANKTAAKRTAAKKTGASKSAAKKSAATKTAATKTAATKAPSKATSTGRTTTATSAKQTAAKKTAAKKSAARKSVADGRAAKKTAAKKTAAKKTAAKRGAATSPARGDA